MKNQEFWVKFDFYNAFFNLFYFTWVHKYTKYLCNGKNQGSYHIHPILHVATASVHTGSNTVQNNVGKTFFFLPLSSPSLHLSQKQDKNGDKREPTSQIYLNL